LRNQIFSFNPKFSEFIDLIKSLAEEKSLLTTRNQYFVVEVVRNIAEYCVFGEKVGKPHMDTFIELNGLGMFAQILKSNNKFVNMQII